MNAAIPTDCCPRILLVDDDPDIHDLVGGMLASLNVELISVTTPESALPFFFDSCLLMIKSVIESVPRHTTRFPRSHS